MFKAGSEWERYRASGGPNSYGRPLWEGVCGMKTLYERRERPAGMAEPRES